MTLFQRRDGSRDWKRQVDCRKSNNVVVVEKSKEKDRGRKGRRRGEDECEVGNRGAPDCWHRLPGDHVPQTDAPARPDRHHGNR